MFIILSIPVEELTLALWASSSDSEQLSPSSEHTSSHDQPAVGDSRHPMVVVVEVAILVVVVHTSEEKVTT